MATKLQIFVRLNKEIVDDLDSSAKLLGCSRTDILQCAIARYLDQPDKVPYAARLSELERRIYDLELIVRSRKK